MRKFLPFVFCGVAALSYSQLGAAADADPGQKPGADQSGNPGAAASDNSNVTRDQSGVYRNKDDKRGARNKRDADSSAGNSSAGSSSAGGLSGKGNDSKAMEKDDSTSAAPGSTGTPGSAPKGTGY